MSLVKSRTVLELGDVAGTAVHFHRRDEIQYEDVLRRLPEQRRVTLTIDRQFWLDLGTPAQITMTVRPGDQLNVEVSA